MFLGLRIWGMNIDIRIRLITSFSQATLPHVDNLIGLSMILSILLHILFRK